MGLPIRGALADRKTFTVCIEDLRNAHWANSGARLNHSRFFHLFGASLVLNKLHRYRCPFKHFKMIRFVKNQWMPVQTNGRAKPADLSYGILDCYSSPAGERWNDFLKLQTTFSRYCLQNFLVQSNRYRW